jgi:uncharacterized integral membrane protein
MSPESTNTRYGKVAAFAFGVLFIIVLIILAVYFPEPSSFQYLVFRTILALAAGGVVAFVPGSIHINHGKSIRAGGAVAVTVMVWLINPAGLISSCPYQ